MNDIERLEKFIRRREKWRTYERKPDQTDLQYLCRKERHMWVLTVIFGIGSLNGIDHLGTSTPYFLAMTVFVVVCTILLWAEATRAQELREIFERTAIQSATEVMEDIKKRAAPSSQQGETTIK